MRRKVRGFFYASPIRNRRFVGLKSVMVGGVLGSREARRILDPVCQPDTSSTALRLTAPVGGYKTTVKESPMNIHDAGEMRPNFPEVTLNKTDYSAPTPTVFTPREANVIKKALSLIEEKCLRQQPVMYFLNDFQRYLILRFAGLTNEQAHALYLDADYRLLAAEVEAVGSQSQVIWNLRNIALRAMTLGAEYVVFAHNHPTGTAIPSEADINHLAGYESILGSLKIKVLDSFVVTYDQAVSIKHYLKAKQDAQERKWQEQREQWAAERKAKREAKRQAKLQAQLQPLGA
jgi:DNA repair protein RadC